MTLIKTYEYLYTPYLISAYVYKDNDDIIFYLDTQIILELVESNKVNLNKSKKINYNVTFETFVEIIEGVIGMYKSRNKYISRQLIEELIKEYTKLLIENEENLFSVLMYYKFGDKYLKDKSKINKELLNAFFYYNYKFFCSSYKLYKKYSISSIAKDFVNHILERFKKLNYIQEVFKNTSVQKVINLFFEGTDYCRYYKPFRNFLSDISLVYLLDKGIKKEKFGVLSNDKDILYLYLYMGDEYKRLENLEKTILKDKTKLISGFPFIFYYKDPKLYYSLYSSLKTKFFLNDRQISYLEEYLKNKYKLRI